jgi:hypothetical protein
MRLEVPGPDLFAEDVESDLYTAIDLVSKKSSSKFASDVPRLGPPPQGSFAE